MEFTDPIYERQECDTSASWRSFCDYKQMPAPRVLSSLHQAYVQAASSQIQPSPPTTKLSTIETWYARGRWRDRVDAYDAYQGALIDQRVAEAKANEVIREVEEYARTARSLGRGNANIAIALTKIMADALRTGTVPAWLPPIREWNDIGIMARAIATAEQSLELWAQAIGVDKISDMAIEVNAEETS